MGPPQGGLTTHADAEPERGFDRLAPRYEELIESNPIHAQLRARSLAWLDEAFGPGMHVLEIGCGTGTEAVHLALRGVEVTATDISPEMVRLTRARVQSHGLGAHVRVAQCSASEIRDRFADTSFDGAFASFGPLNGEPELAQAIEGLASALRPGAPFVTSIVSRPCAAELAVGIARLNLPKAFRRLRDSTSNDLAGTGPVQVRAYSEAEVRRALAPWFDIERIEGWLVAIPPPYMATTWQRLEVLHTPASRLDVRLRSRPPFRGWGDHLHVWARRRAR